MTTPVYVEDIIAGLIPKVIAQVLDKIKANDAAVNGTTKIQTIDFQFGHTRELLETLSQYDRDPAFKFMKYPLIWLVTDYPEDRGREPGIYADAKLNICIIHQSLNTYKSTERLSKVFKPVLYPIYYSLLDQMANCNMINNGVEEKISHRKWDRFYMGKQGSGGNVADTLADFVDAIEIENMNLKIRFQNCL